MRNCADMPKTLAGQKKRGEGTAEEEKQKKQKKEEKKKETKRKRQAQFELAVICCDVIR